MVSLVIPCFNEAAGIGNVLARVPADVDEVVVVDNASTDGTADVARRLGALVVEEPRRGYGRAYKTGFEAARGAIIVTMDGDGTYPPEAIPTLVAELRERNLDFISTRRQGSSNFVLLLGNGMLSLAARLLFHIPFRDSQSGMWVLRRDVLPAILPASDAMPFSQELKIRASRSGLRCAEVPIPYAARIGSSKLVWWRDGLLNMLALLRLRISGL